MSTAAESLTGSDGSAAGGGRSDLSEWLRSVSDAGVRAKESTGHRNRGRTLILPSGKMQTNLRRVTPLKVAQTASYLEKSPSVLTNLISPQAKCKRISRRVTYITMYKQTFLCNTNNEVLQMKGIFLFLLLPFLITGCYVPEQEAYYSRQVEVMEIRRNEQSVTLTEPSQIEAILSYLRLLPRLNTTVPDPQQMASQGVEIILTYIGGQQKHILQKGAYYLSENHLPFSPIDEELGAQLMELLRGIH